MSKVALTGLDASDPLGYLAAIGTLRTIASRSPSARLHWVNDGALIATLTTHDALDPVHVLVDDLERWRSGHAAVDFAIGADRKVQDLKHAPVDFRSLMRDLATDVEASPFVAAYATGVAIDGRGQTKPTALHFSAGQQRFMDAVLSLRDEVTRADLEEALFGPWIGREGPKDLRWRAASERSRALLSFDPSKESAKTVAGACWLAFQALPHFPVVPIGSKAVTTCFSGRGKREFYTWPIWSEPLSVDEVRTLLAIPNLVDMATSARRARGISFVLQSKVTRSDMGYGNFSASQPV